MDAKTTGIVAYITWIGLVIAFVLGDREGAKFHLNQALVIWLAGLLPVPPPSPVSSTSSGAGPAVRPAPPSGRPSGRTSPLP